MSERIKAYVGKHDSFHREHWGVTTVWVVLPNGDVYTLDTISKTINPSSYTADSIARLTPEYFEEV
jgi:hypothetical protein